MLAAVCRGGGSSRDDRNFLYREFGPGLCRCDQHNRNPVGNRTRLYRGLGCLRTPLWAARQVRACIMSNGVWAVWLSKEYHRRESTRSSTHYKNGAILMKMMLLSAKRSFLTVILALSPLSATVATETNIAITGSQSPVDGACVAPLPFFNGQDCSYNASNPTTFGTVWMGPVATGGYYQVGQSPFALGGNMDDTPVVVRRATASQQHYYNQ
jgi:hypothetical protein